MTSEIQTRIKSYRNDANGVTQYELESTVTDPNSKEKVKTAVHRRFNQFASLHADLRANGFARSQVPSLPSKIFGTDATTRAVQLEAYLVAANACCAPVGVTKASVPRELVQFLGLSDVEFGKPDASFTVEYGSHTVPEKYSSDVERVYAEVIKLEAGVAANKGTGLPEGWEPRWARRTVGAGLPCRGIHTPGRKATAWFTARCARPQGSCTNSSTRRTLRKRWRATWPALTCWRSLMTIT